MIRDKVNRWQNEIVEATEVVVRDLQNRARGVVAETQSAFSPEHRSDRSLAARVHSELGHVCSHPRAVEVEVHRGRARLTGAVLSSEVQHVFDCARSVPGIVAVDNHLEVHQHPSESPQLQGGASRGSLSPLQEPWAPGTQCMASTAGSLLLLYGLATRSFIKSALGSVVLGMAASKACDTFCAQGATRKQSQRTVEGKGGQKQSEQAEGRRSSGASGPGGSGTSTSPLETRATSLPGGVQANSTPSGSAEGSPKEPTSANPLSSGTSMG
jgi:hypothetical protein